MQWWEQALEEIVIDDLNDKIKAESEQIIDLIKELPDSEAADFLSKLQEFIKPYIR